MVDVAAISAEADVMCENVAPPPGLPACKHDQMKTKDVPMTDDLLSHGQKQLFCVARAVLRTSKILILDEVTSSVDQETESIILDVLRERFPDHTVMCIAHRLKTILDYDQVIALDDGRIVECGNPATLASQPSRFADLLRATGDHSMTS